MSRKLENIFSWSKSRDELFRECRRKYYYEKYGSWGGWERTADPKTRELYILKQVKSRRMWLGESVHRAIERVLKGYQAGKSIPKEEIVALMTDEMRRDYRVSKAGEYRRDPKRNCSLFEHVYEMDVSRQEWARIHDDACRCVANFYGCGLLKRAQAAGVDAWLPVEEFQSFNFEGVKVFVKLDFAFREQEKIVIVDWKTGVGEDVDVTVQLGCYAIYASQRWGMEPENIETIEFNVNTLKENTYSMIEARLEWARHYMRNSIDAMRKTLEDPDKNEAHIDRFERRTDRSKCRWCNYRKPCLPDEVF